MFKYILQILEHKWWVLYYGWQMHVPLWQLLIHDWSKFMWVEFDAYFRKFYKKELEEWEKLYWEYAFLHHIHLSPHHWEYFVLHGKPLRMPDNYALEMVADWKAAGKVYQGKDEAKEWYFKDPTRFQLHPSTKNTVEGLLLVYEDPKNSPHCSCGVDKFWSKKPWYKHKRFCALYYSVVGIKEALESL